MKILVTGGAGFIGSHLCEYLGRMYSDKDTIDIVDNSSTGNINNLTGIFGYHNMILFDKNIVDFKNKYLYDIIFHLATPNTNAREGNILHTMEDIDNFWHLKSMLKENGKFFYFSSGAVYGECRNAKEDDEHIPKTSYGMCKSLIEYFVKEQFKNYVIVRPSVVFGARQSKSKESGIIGIIRDCLENNKEVSLYNKGKNRRDFIWVNDVITAVGYLIDKQGEYNISYGKTIKIIDLLKYSKVKYIDKGFRKEPLCSGLNNKKLRKLGWQPTRNAMSGLLYE